MIDVHSLGWHGNNGLTSAHCIPLTGQILIKCIPSTLYDYTFLYPCSHMTLYQKEHTSDCPEDADKTFQKHVN